MTYSSSLTDKEWEIKVAVARKLSMILFAMWRDDKQWYYNQEALNAARAAARAAARSAA